MLQKSEVEKRLNLVKNWQNFFVSFGHGVYLSRKHYRYHSWPAMNGGHFSASKDMNSYVCLTYPYQPSENNILRRESSPSPHPQIYHKVMTFRGSLHQAKIAVLFIGSVVAPWPHAYMEQILLRVVPPCQCW